MAIVRALLAQFFRFSGKNILMDSNIIEAIRKNLGYPPSEKIDPNTQEAKNVNKISSQQRLNQAAVPAVLAAMIKFSDGPDGMNLFAENDNWLHLIYAGKENNAVTQVANYAGVSNEDARQEMTNVAGEAVNV